MTVVATKLSLMTQTQTDVVDEAYTFLDEAQRHVDFLFSPKVVMPGDDVTEIVTRSSKQVRLGMSLYENI